MRELKVTTHVFPISPGKPGAPIGTREWADWLRLSLVSMVDHIGEEDDHLLSTIEFTKEHRAWTLMNKPDGSFFSTIEDFCAFRKPYGLGKSWTNLRPFLVAGMAKRGTPADEIERTLQLEAVPEAQPPKPGPGRGNRSEDEATAKKIYRHDGGPSSQLDADSEAGTNKTTPHGEGVFSQLDTDSEAGTNKTTPHGEGVFSQLDTDSEAGTNKTTPHGEGVFSHAQNERLRAITRAPESVKDAYREGRISQTLAAKLGPKNPSPETAAHIAEIAAKIRQVPDRKTVDTIVRERLGAPAPTAVDRVVRSLERLSPEQRTQFFRRVEALRSEAVS